jgi:hypothetical protein
MFENVIHEIDAQIARLQQARAALAGTSTGSATGKRRGRPPGRPKGSVNMAASGAKRKRRGGMSPEGRARIAAAQKARWAKIKAGK